MKLHLSPRGPDRVRWEDTQPISGGSGRLLRLLRAALLATAVFVLAAVIGGLLAGTAPAGEQPPVRQPAAHQNPVEAGEPAASEPASGDPAARQAAPGWRGGHELGLSLVYTGAAGLLVSMVGTVIVLRRRRLW